MGDKTKIEWTDASWNPLRGCSRLSEGCRHCYAEKQAARIIAMDRGRGVPDGSGSYDGLLAAGGQWSGVIRVVEDALDIPLRWRKPRRIFVNSMSDLFHENVPDEVIDKVFAVMTLAHWHTFQVLTKRPERMRAYLTDHAAGGRHIWDAGREIAMPRGQHKPGTGWPLQNVWLGVSVENQQAADERIPLLLSTPAAVRWISAEPLLGPVNLNLARCLNGCGWITPAKVNSDKDLGCPKCKALVTRCSSSARYSIIEKRQIDWVVVGGESGPHARPMHPDWARSLRDQCAAAGVPLLFKQWGEWVPMVGAVDGWSLGDDPEQSRFDHRDWNGDRWSEPYRPQWCDELDDDTVSRIGKKKAGRLLDGVQHDGYPESLPT